MESYERDSSLLESSGQSFAMIDQGLSGSVRAGQTTLLLFLFLAAVLAYVDRQFITIAAEVLHTDLGLSDVEIGLIGGPSFSLCFAIFGLPISILVDRYNRIRILGLAMICWSVATMACGLSQSFVELFIARTFVGIGEAALAPVAYSLIGDNFDRLRIPRATGVYAAGTALGSGFAVLGGGYLLAFFASHSAFGLQNWQSGFISFGFLGLPFAFLLMRFLKDDRRVLQPGAYRTPPISIFKFFGNNRGFFIPLLLAACFYMMFFGGFLAWSPAFFMRTFGWTAMETGALFGSPLTFFSIIAAPLAGQLSLVLERRGVSNTLPGLVIFSLGGILLVTVVGSLSSHWLISLIAFSIVPLLHGGVGAIIPGMIVRETLPHLRGRMIASFLFLMQIGGYGLGPVIYAGATEYLFGGRANLYLSLATLTPCILLFAILAMVFVARALPRNRAVITSSVLPS